MSEQPVSRDQVRREWLSVSAYARKYGVDRNTVYKWEALGLLELYRVGAVVRIKDQKPTKP